MPDIPKASFFTGWKLHLQVVSRLEDQLTYAIHRLLEDRKTDHKVGHRGETEDGKGMTIYVGSFDRAAALARELSKTFKPVPMTADAEAARQELPVAQGVCMRFVCDGIPLWDQYGAQFCGRGISELECFSAKKMKLGVSLSVSGVLLAHAMGVDQESLKDHKNLMLYQAFCTYISHRIFQEKLGPYYTGTPHENRLARYSVAAIAGQQYRE
nr:hypothetical protein [Pseudomonadota bacterium]